MKCTPFECLRNVSSPPLVLPQPISCVFLVWNKKSASSTSADLASWEPGLWMCRGFTHTGIRITHRIVRLSVSVKLGGALHMIKEKSGNPRTCLSWKTDLCVQVGCTTMIPHLHGDFSTFEVKRLWTDGLFSRRRNYCKKFSLAKHRKPEFCPKFLSPSNRTPNENVVSVLLNYLLLPEFR